MFLTKPGPLWIEEISMRLFLVLRAVMIYLRPPVFRGLQRYQNLFQWIEWSWKRRIDIPPIDNKNSLNRIVPWAPDAYIFNLVTIQLYWLLHLPKNSREHLSLFLSLSLSLPYNYRNYIQFTSLWVSNDHVQSDVFLPVEKTSHNVA